MKTKVKIACAIAVISKLTLWLGLLIGSIGVAMLVWECNQPLGWKVMMTGGFNNGYYRTVLIRVLFEQPRSRSRLLGLY